MEYEEVDSIGRVPEFGAIFMANIATKKECFRHKLFGLPSALTHFVKQVKAGMVLFLFEFERRELFGVYRACSDGAMNIVPNAFSSVGRQYPAQVRFDPIWYCNPLCEKEFQGAISENYFSAKKFNFGLSEDQVRRLLLLFCSRKLRTRIPRRPFTSKITRLPDRKLVDGGGFALNDGVGIESDGDDGFRPGYLGDSPVNSPGPAKIMEDDWVEEHKFDYLSDTLGKRRRGEKDSRFFMTDGTKNEDNNDHAPVQVIRGDIFPDSWGKVRSISDDDQVFTGDRVESERAMGNTFGSVRSTEYHGNYIDRERSVAEDGRFLMRGNLGNEYKLDSGFGQVISNEHLNDGRVLVNDSIDDECIMDDCFRRVIPTEHIEDFLGKVRRETDADRFWMNDRLQTDHNVDSGIRPVKSTEQLGNVLDMIRRPIDDGRLLMGERVETKRSFEVGMGPLFSSEHLENPLGKGRSAANEGRLSIGDKKGNKHDVNNSFGLPLSFKYSGHAVGKERHVSDSGSFRNIDRVDNGDMDNYIGPARSSEYNAMPTKQNPLHYFSKPKIGTDYSFLQDQLGDSSTFPRLPGPQISDSSYPTSHDPIGTRASPHNTRVPNFNCGHPSSFVADHSTSECLPDHIFERNLFSSPKSRSSPRLQPKGLSRCLDAVSDYGNKFALPTTTSHHDYSGCLTRSLLSDVGYSGNRELNHSAYNGYRGSLFSESSLDPVPFSKGEIYKKENEGPLSYPSGFSKNQSFAFDNEYHVVPGGQYEHRSLRCASNEGFSDKNSPFSNANKSLGIYRHEKDLISQGNESYRAYEGMHPDSKNNRTSVFARLSSVPVVDSVKHDENDPEIVSDGHINATVDEVMDTLRQYQNHPVKKLRKLKPLFNQHDDEEIATYKEPNPIKKTVDYDDLKMQTMRINIDAYQAIEENDDQMLKETRVVEFKRRSKTKKNLDETGTKASIGIVGGKKSSGRQCKRKKLVRPVFDRKESCDEGISCEGPPDQKLCYMESPLRKINYGGHEDLGKSFENNGMPSCNVGSLNVILRTSCDDNSDTAKQGLNCKEIKSSENSGAFRCNKGEDEKSALRNSEISRVSFKKTTPKTQGSVRTENYTGNDLSRVHPGMISSSYIAYESSPGLAKEMADHGNCRGDSDLIQSVEKAQGNSPFTIEPINVRPENDSKLVEPEIGEVSESHASAVQMGEGKILDY